MLLVVTTHLLIHLATAITPYLHQRVSPLQCFFIQRFTPGNVKLFTGALQFMGRVGRATSHRQYPSPMIQLWIANLCGNHILSLFLATLHHESLNHPIEVSSVIDSLLHLLHEVIPMQRSLVIEGQYDLALCGVECHRCPLLRGLCAKAP